MKTEENEKERVGRPRVVLGGDNGGRPRITTSPEVTNHRKRRVSVDA